MHRGESTNRQQWKEEITKHGQEQYELQESEEEEIQQTLASIKTQIQMDARDGHTETLGWTISLARMCRARLSEGKYTGGDSQVIPEMMTLLDEEGLDEIHRKFTGMFDKGEEKTPESWKNVNIIMMAKTPRARSMEQFRGISLLSSPSKLFAICCIEVAKTWADTHILDRRHHLIYGSEEHHSCEELTTAMQIMLAKGATKVYRRTRSSTSYLRTSARPSTASVPNSC